MIELAITKLENQQLKSQLDQMKETMPNRGQELSGRPYFIEESKSPKIPPIIEAKNFPSEQGTFLEQEQHLNDQIYSNLNDQIDDLENLFETNKM